MKKSIYKRLLPLSLALLGGLCSCSGALQKPDDSYDQKPSAFDFQYDREAVIPGNWDNTGALTGFSRQKETSLLALYVNEETANIAVEDKRSGKLWAAIPLDLDSDSQATAEMKELMSSVVKIDYIDGNAVHTLNSYTNCVLEDKLEITSLENGVRFVYNMNNYKRTYDDLPKKINKERFTRFFIDSDKLTEVDVTRVENYFEFNEKGNYYERTRETNTVLRALGEIMDKVGYTPTELEIDNREFGISYTPPKQTAFRIAVDYYLQNDSLIVDVPLDELFYEKEYPPLKIRLNEYLMQSRGAENGYLLIPDGSGALVNFSKGENDTGRYELPLYGPDLVQSNREHLPRALTAKMPVYGMAADGAGALAIIEDGDAFANVTAQKANTVNSYNSISADFDVFRFANVTIGDGSIKSKVPVIQAGMYRGSLRTRYVLFAKECTYSSMAACYRKYLSARDGLKAPGYAARAELFLELTGAITKTESVMGFQYEGVQNLTTFKQARDILEDYAEAGITNIHLKYSGALKGGLRNYEISGADILPGLGGAKGYKSLVEFLEGHGGKAYLSARVMTVPSKSGGFNRYRQSSRTIDQSLAKRYEFNLVSQKKTDFDAVVSPAYLPEYLGKYLSAADKMNIADLGFEDLGGTIYADYHKNAVYTAQTAKNQIAALLAQMAGKNVLLTAPYMDSVRYAGALVDMPLYANMASMIDQSVPFMQLVLSGVIPYAGTPYNQAEDKEYWWLKTLETGACPHFSLFYEANTVLQNTDYTYLVSNNYLIWKNDVLRLMKEYQVIRDAVSGSYMIDHKQLESGLYRSVYANGYSILVNYANREATFDGRTVGAGNYLLVKEG